MTEAWMPLTQAHDRVFYGDARMMGDDGDNREWNLGLGYRELTAGGQSVMGVHGWLDRRRSERGSVFHQVAGGVEYMSDGLDIRLNGYIPFNEKETYTIDSGGVDDPYLADTGIFYDADGQLVEKPLHGMDLELSIPVSFLEEKIESFRVSAGGFIFDDSDAETLRGARLRAVADITPDLSLGARFETDNQRGSQGFAEITLRLPFGSKASQKTLGLRGRLDESPERDIDVVTAAQTTIAPTLKNPVLNADTGTAQRVFHVDNTAAPGGDGSLDNPFNTLADAESAADQAGDVIYVNRGDGTSTGMDQGITVSSAGQSLIGSGSCFVYDSNRFTTATGENFSGSVLRAAGAAPVMTNGAGSGITVAAADVSISGITIDGATQHGIYAAASGGDDLGTLTLQNVTLSNNTDDGLHVAASGAGSAIDAALTNVRAEGNHNGIRYYATSDAAVTGMMESSIATANTQHGVIIYDDSTAGSVDVDLGGGARSGGLNGLYGNTLEDLAVELDGATLTAQNNWWGQAGGIISGQLYLGAPLDDDLVAHWEFDDGAGATATDRSGVGGLSLMNGAGFSANGKIGGALLLDGVNDYARDSGSVARALTNDFTLSVWVNPAAPLDAAATFFRNVFFYRGDTSGTTMNYQLQMTDDDTIEFKERSPAQGIQSRVFNGVPSVTGNWSYVALTITGGNASLYVNGTHINTLAVGTLDSQVGHSVYFGASFLGAGAQHYMQGMIDDARIYSRVLSPTEIAELYRMDTTSAVDTSGFLTAAP